MDRPTVELAILNFIRDRFPKRAFRRGKEEEARMLLPFRTYEDFLAEQRRILRVVPEAQLERYRITMLDLHNRMYKQMDKEYMMFGSSRGFFLIEGRIFLFSTQ